VREVNCCNRERERESKSELPRQREEKERSSGDDAVRLVVVDLRLSTVLTMSGTRNRAATCAPAVDEQSHARHPRLRDALRWNCRPSSPPSFLSKDFPPLSDFETKNSLVQPRRGRRRSASRSWSPTSCGARPWRLGMGRREAGTGRRGGREEEQFFALAWPLSLSLSLSFLLWAVEEVASLFSALLVPDLIISPQLEDLFSPLRSSPSSCPFSSVSRCTNVRSRSTSSP